MMEYRVIQLVWTSSGELFVDDPVCAKLNPGPEGGDRTGGIAGFMIDLGMRDTLSWAPQTIECRVGNPIFFLTLFASESRV